MALLPPTRLRKAAGLIIVPLALATTLSPLGGYFWFFDLLVHFKVQYAVALAAGLAVALFARAPLLAALAALGLVINGLQIALPSQAVASKAASKGSLDLRIITYNVFLGRQHDPRVTEFLASSGGDIIVLEEFPAEDAPGLMAALPGFSYWTAEGATMTQGAVILSRWPIVSSTAVPLSDQPTHVTRAEIEAKGHRFVVYGTHLQWPMVPHLAALRNWEMEALAQETAQCSGACIVVGDLNTTPWSSHFRKLLESGRLHDCASQQPLLTSWPTYLVPGRIRIDHCLVNDHWRIRRATRGPALPSDHFPMVYDVSLIDPATANTATDTATPLASRTAAAKARGIP